jgi:hypothetical protein
MRQIGHLQYRPDGADFAIADRASRRTWGGKAMVHDIAAVRTDIRFLQLQVAAVIALVAALGGTMLWLLRIAAQIL